MPARSGDDAGAEAGVPDTEAGAVDATPPRDSGADGPSPCELVDGVCVGGEGCCPYGGFALDADAGCLSAKLTVLGCVRQFEPTGTNADCACNASQSCLAALRDGGNDGPVYWRRDGCLYDPAKFGDCSPDVEGQAYMASTRPACR